MRKLIPFLLGVIFVMAAIFLQLSQIPMIERWIVRLENVAYDIEMQAKTLTKRGAEFKTDIVIVDIDDKSLEKEGRWPWPRSKLAVLIEKLQQEGAAVVAFDMLFPEEEVNIALLVSDELQQKKLMNSEIKSVFEKITPYFKGDKLFAESLSKMDSVIGFSFSPLKRVSGVVPNPIIQVTKENQDLDFIEADGVVGINPILALGAKYAGFVNAFQDEDGIIRRSPLLMRYQNGLYPSIALEAVRLYLLTNVELFAPNYGDRHRLEGIKVGGKLIQTDEESQVIVPFRGGSYTFPYISATDVLQNNIKGDPLAGKIVFVGSTAAGLGDLKAVSVTKIFPGVEINATIADGLLKNNFPLRPSWAPGAEVSITFGLGIVMALLFPYFGTLVLTASTFLIPVFLALSNSWFHEKTGIILSIFIPAVLSVVLASFNSIYRYLFETREKARLKKIFGQYVPETHIDAMLGSSSDYGLMGEERDMSVLFADIRNFTGISETMQVSQLKEMLNTVFTEMTQIIFDNKGTIDKYIGDLIMAYWGAPLKDPQHTENALNAVLEMKRKLVEIKPMLLEHGWPEINMGFGLNSGIMDVGDMGSKFRRNYTVLGDAVNLASRVESLTKYYGVKIIVTDNTARDQNKFVFRLLDRVLVKGRKLGVEIYELVCRQTELTDELRLTLQKEAGALHFYFNSHFDQSKQLFLELAKESPEIRLYQIYLNRIEEFLRSPPPLGWDGVYEHKIK